MPELKAIPRNYCPVDRYHISALADIIGAASNAHSDSDIAEVLRGTVNIAREKISKEHKREFTPQNSISAYEAYAFIKKLKVTGSLDGEGLYAFVARGMHKIFFDERLFDGRRKPQRVRVNDYHDADTCKVTVASRSQCNTEASTISVRITGIDAPEVGHYYEKAADRIRGKNNPYRRVNRFDAAGGGWVNPKLVDNVDKVHRELARNRWKPKELSYRERAAINNIIAATIAYTGEIATIPMNDLLSWEIDNAMAGAMLMYDSQVRWTSSDTPACLCGSWQPYDIYGRNLNGFMQSDETRLGRYIHNRLHVVMREAGRPLYTEYRKKVAKHLKTLSRSKEPHLKRIAKLLVDDAPKAEVIYSKKRCEEIAAAYEDHVKGSSVKAKDMQLMQVFIGSVYPYIKYRNQMSDVYMDAKTNFGLWSELTFKTLWRVNMRKKRYNPPDCLKE